MFAVSSLLMRGALILVILMAVSGCAQLVTIEPDKPMWGKDLIVTYNPSADDAMFSSSDDVYLVGWLYLADSSTHLWRQMERKDDVFRSVLSIPEGLAYAVFYFITLTGYDENADAGTMIYRPDGIPARGAYRWSMRKPFFVGDYMDRFTKELALYPDNYAAYRDKWLIASVFAPESVSEIVKKDMEMLTSKREKDRPDLLYALSYGYLMMGQEAESRAIVEKLLRLYPGTVCALSALNSYIYKTEEMEMDKARKAELKVLIAQTMERHPQTDFVREHVQMLLCNDTLPLTAIEAVFDGWVRDESDNPMPYYVLANAYNCRNQKLDSAAALIANAINLSWQGYLRFYKDLRGRHSHRYLSWMHESAAKISFKREDYENALSNVKAAQDVTDESDLTLPLLEAQILQKLGEDSLSFDSYRMAWRMGSDEARDSLEAAYLRGLGSLEGFQDFLDMQPDNSDRKPAPDFKVTSLDGERFELSRLSGKVVVLNIWAIGCGPCRIEIPGLNKLVDTFKDQEVVFLGLAPDSENRLRRFLSNRPFHYIIVPRASNTIRKLGAFGYPVHIIIDKRGRIAYKLFGGSKDRHENLLSLIEHLLSE